MLKRADIAKVTAALGAAALLAGCGAAGSASTSAATTSTVASTTASGGFDSALLSTSSPGPAQVKTKAKKASSKSTAKPKPKPKPSTKPKTTSTTSTTTSTTTTTPVDTHTGASSTPTTTIHTVTVVEHLPAPPIDVPGEAHLPASQVAHVPAFTTPGGNIACVLSTDSVRCDIGVRVWTPPAKPSTCQLDWGQGITVGPTGPAQFVCSGNTTFSAHGQLVNDEVDDKWGSITCQVRAIGVTCFDTGYHGFSLSRTGYTVF